MSLVARSISTLCVLAGVAAADPVVTVSPMKAHPGDPVLVTVSSPDGGLTLQRSRYTIRSSFVSGVGVFLAVGAGLFLAIWWLTHWRRSRKARTPALAT